MVGLSIKIPFLFLAICVIYIRIGKSAHTPCNLKRERFSSRLISSTS